MDLKQEILKEHSRAQAQKIADYVGHDPDKFKRLFDLFLSDEYRVAQRAAFAVGICGQRYPDLIEPYLKLMILNLKNKKIHDAVRRNSVRHLQSIDIPFELQGIAYEQCFQIMTSNSEPIAIKVFAMTVLANICQKEPGLAGELRLIIEDQLPYASAGFLSRAKKILKTLPN